ncbi:hypothetical protein H4R34_000665 [Dimargaris verticillata]|uniref:Uncharacterized protein n=1 Tax=Dimargaris verticillata TaxID=2761393 RepID=A0A9W8EB18_9FUNG|nr:hypothetical protein H4R34_000665 [Dimargaris verticillata]
MASSVKAGHPPAVRAGKARIAQRKRHTERRASGELAMDADHPALRLDSAQEKQQHPQRRQSLSPSDEERREQYHEENRQRHEKQQRENLARQEHHAWRAHLDQVNVPKCSFQRGSRQGNRRLQQPQPALGI